MVSTTERIVSRPTPAAVSCATSGLTGTNSPYAAPRVLASSSQASASVGGTVVSPPPWTRATPMRAGKRNGGSAFAASNTARSMPPSAAPALAEAPRAAAAQCGRAEP